MKLIAILHVLLAALNAGDAELFCDDLSLVAELPRVDFPTEIQPIFDQNSCSVCHGGGALSLLSEESYEHLYCQPATQAPAPAGSLLVVPFDPAGSWLFLRVNCSTAAGDFRMPAFGPGSELGSTDQALIRDWIRQGARPSAEDLFASGFEANETCRQPAE